MVRIRVDDIERVIKNGGRFLKCDSMRRNVLLCFLVVPFKVSVDHLYAFL